MAKESTIEILGARTHNLKNIDLRFDKNQLIVFTGLSGSGKSSLAFDTLFAEGQRRYLETFSSYARQFIGSLERPDVDKIDGLPPVISIEQKTVSKSPRSTVGTITELYDFLRLLYARTATAYSMETGKPMVRYTDEEITQQIIKTFDGQKIALLAPKVRGRKGHYKELFEQFIKQGYTKARIDGQLVDLTPGMQLDRYKIHDIEVVIDRLVGGEKAKERIQQSVTLAMKMGEGMILVLALDHHNSRYFSRSLMCEDTGISYPNPEPNLFSFNSPYGACPKCQGLGEISNIALDKVMPDKTKSIYQGGILPLGPYKSNWLFDKLGKIVQGYGKSLRTPLGDFTDHELSHLMYGNEDMVIEAQEAQDRFEGVVQFVLKYQDDETSALRRWVESFLDKGPCSGCNGYRLRTEALHFKIGNKHIGEVGKLELGPLSEWIIEAEQLLSRQQKQIAGEIFKELNARIHFILNVGLTYLSLDRPARTLSGGEAQRIRLATQIGTALMNVLYILDEPSIGLHQRDNQKLIESLKELRDTGNTVLVVEHDKDMILASDYMVDIGPKAGKFGGEIAFAGNHSALKKAKTLTANYLNGSQKISIPSKRREGSQKVLSLRGASGNTLKNVELTIPLETLVCVTGVSGSGKSTLINGTLLPLLKASLYKSPVRPMPYQSIDGLAHVDKVIEIDQSPIGRTPRSNPATYTKVFDEIRSLFASLPEAQIRGYKPGRFSFNVSGGKCETCNGGGLRLIEMNFLPDVYVTCESCQGKRYNDDTLSIRYRGKSIAEVLEMPISEAHLFFDHIPKIKRILGTLESVGMGYVTLGQSATTLSGGEAQRVKLATELAKKASGKTMYLLDEPSTGLHFEDIRLLLGVLQRLVDEGNTVLVIEHNMDIIKCADYIIDLGPEGGRAGGSIVGTGTPEAFVKAYHKTSHTAKYLAEELR
ncbi:MAG: excinuclease ABC subunit UvrA [Flavobacteriales bacterium]